MTQKLTSGPGFGSYKNTLNVVIESADSKPNNEINGNGNKGVKKQRPRFWVVQNKSYRGDQIGRLQTNIRGM